MEESDYKNIDDLIARRLSGETSSEEDAMLDEWISEKESNRVYFEQLRQVWDTVAFLDSSARFDWHIPFRQWISRISENGNCRRKRMSWLKYACAACVGAIICLASVILFDRDSAFSVSESTASIVTVETPVATHTRVVLPDGSVAVLNGGSSISYPAEFKQKERNVAIVGKAYFDVAHNAERPFTVTSGNLKVKVLGTRFTFSDYGKSRPASVTLIEGKVDVELGNDRSFILSPSERLTYDRHSGRTVLSIVDTLSETLWSRGILRFDETPLAEAVYILEESYGQPIELQNETLYAIRVNGQFDIHTQSIHDVLTLFESTGRMKYSIQGKKIVLN